MQYIRSLLLFLLSLSLGTVSEAQVLRFTYEYWYKRDAEAKGYHLEEDMTLDWDGSRGAFYSEATYLCDSIGTLAFDRRGEIVDEEKYAERMRMNYGHFNRLHIDYGAQRFYQDFDGALVHVRGNGILEMPEWELLDEEQEFRGHRCRKAQADYLGRRWTAWYTEEIPVNAGPWLLWGLPGLIVGATDSEKLFQFALRWTEEVAESRYDALDEYYLYSIRNNWHEWSYEEASKYWTRYKTDLDFQSQAVGGMIVRSFDRNGLEDDPRKYMKYIPIVPDAYWGKKSAR